MMVCNCVVAVILLSMTAVMFADASNFLAGIIQWSPVGERTIQIFHRVSWRRSLGNNRACRPHEGTLLDGQGTLECRSGCLGTVGDMSFHCTDFSILEDWVTGTRAYNYTLPASNSSFEASFSGCCWNYGRNASWEVKVKGSIARRPDGLINSSPVTAIKPIIRLQHGCSYVIRIAVEDPDQDIIRCRWAESARGECGQVCNAFLNATLDQENCVISYNAIYQVGLYAVTIQIEDFISSTSTESLSSVPLQFLVNVSDFNQPCSTKPVFVLPTPPDGFCIPVVSSYTASLVAYDEISSITDIQTISPQGLHHTGVSQSSFNSSIYFINITWTPTIEQFGINLFCFTATNVHGFSSDQRCITLLGGVGGPRVLPNSISPTGLFSHTLSTTWTMTFDQPVQRPKDPRFIRLYECGMTTHVYSIDVTNSSEVVFPLSGSDGRLVTFGITYQFEPGKQYYLLVDAGIAVGDKFCNQESYPIANDTFWTITIKTASIELTPGLGNMLGGTGILIEGPSFTGEVECSFDGVDGSVKILNSTLAVCVSPLLQKIGSIPFMLTIGDDNPLEAQFLSISAEQAHAVTFTGDDIDLLISQDEEITFRWYPESLVPNTLVNTVTVDISLQLLFYNKGLLPHMFNVFQVVSLKTNTENDGEEKVFVDLNRLATTCPYTVSQDSFSICPVLFKISISANQYLPSGISIWTGVAFIQQNNVYVMREQCGMWKDTTTHISAHLHRLNRCPPNQLVANFDLFYQREDRTSIITSSRVYHNMFMSFFHPGIKQCYRQSVPDSGGSGQQCCYGNDGVLMKSQVGGTADSASPLSKYYTHVLQDLMPYVLCCKGEIPICDSYVEGRPEGSATDYRLPLPGTANLVGSTHVLLLNSISPTGLFSPTPSTTWTMTFDQPVQRPKDSRFIRLYESDMTTPVYSIDVTNSTEVVFPLSGSNGRLVTFGITYQFEPGKRYYLLMDAGIAVGDIGCNMESYPITDDTFWTIRIKITSIELTVRLGNMLGGTGILIERPSFTGKVKCSFDGVNGSVKILNSTLAVCVCPLLQKSGSIPFMLTIGDENPLKDQFLSISAEQAHAVTFTGDDIDLLITHGKEITFLWSPESLVPNTLVNNVTVDISLQLLFYNKYTHVFKVLEVKRLMMNTDNDGEEKVVVNLERFTVSCPYTASQDYFSTCPVSFKLSISANQYLPSGISIWTGIAFVQQNSINVGRLRKECGKWRRTATSIFAHLDRLNRCPPNQVLANFDRLYQREDRTSIITFSRVYHNMFMSFFHPGIKQCYRQSVPDSGGSGQQCCYGNDGVLMKSQVGGTADSASPISKYYTHVLQDLMPYVLCCKGEMSVCATYVEGRPEANETDYRLTLPVFPHLPTGDGSTC